MNELELPICLSILNQTIDSQVNDLLDKEWVFCEKVCGRHEYYIFFKNSRTKSVCEELVKLAIERLKK